MNDQVDLLEKQSITFGIRSENVSVSTVNEDLGIAPSRAFNKGEPLLRTAKLHKHPWTAWSWCTEGKVHANSMEAHAEYLLGVFEPKAESIAKYLNDPACDVVIRIDWQANYLEGGYSLSTTAMRRLTAICKRVDFGFLILQ
jgi:hypothetical protein